MTFSMQRYVPEAKQRLGTARRWLGWQAVFPVLLGVLFTLGTRATAGSGTIDWTSYEFYQCLVISVALFCILYAVGYRLIVIQPALGAAARMRASKVNPGGAEALTVSEALSRQRDSVLFRWTPKAVLLGALVILACWALYIYCLFPGTMWYDTSWQVYEHLSSTYSNGTLSDHHPFMLVYLYGFFIELGRSLFNDGAKGMFVLVCIQIVACVIAMSMICCYIHAKLGAHWGFSLAALLFFALFPYLPMTYCSIVKDTLQTVLLMYFAMMFAEVVRTRGDVLKHAWFPVVLILLSLGICVSKKLGVYMIGPALIALAFMRLKNGGRLLMPIIGAFLFAFMLVILPRVVMPALNVEPGGKQEMLAVPIQQVAHEYVQYTKGEDGYEDAFSSDDEDMLNHFLTISTDKIPSEFDYTIVDPIKDGALGDESLIPDFLQLWWRLGTEHPLGHIEAWAGMEAGWISYEPQITVKVASGTIANNDFVSKYVTWPASSVKNDFVTDIFNFVGSIPGLNVLYAQSLWASVLPLFCVFIVLRSKGTQRWGRWDCLLAIMPYLLSSATLFLCPVSTGVEVARYILPLVCLAPLCVPYAVMSSRSRLVETLEPTPEGSSDGDVSSPAVSEGAKGLAEPEAARTAKSDESQAKVDGSSVRDDADKPATDPSHAEAGTGDANRAVNLDYAPVQVKIAPKPSTASPTDGAPDPRPDAPEPSDAGSDRAVGKADRDSNANGRA